MMTLTQNALAEIMREKDFSPEEMLAYLRERNNFMSISEGIKRELRRLSYSGSDHQLRDAFLGLMKEKSLNSSELKSEKSWFADKSLPSPAYAIKLCFAFSLLNFRRAKEGIKP